MNSLQERLKAEDPVAHEAPLSNEDIQQMRRTVLTAAQAPRPQPIPGRRRAWAVAGVAATLAIAAGVSHWSRAANILPPPTDGSVETTPRQLQFATPAGTRVIWVFHPDFQP